MATSPRNERQPLLPPTRNVFQDMEPVFQTPIQIDPSILARAIQIASAEQAAAISGSQLQGVSHPAPNTISIDPAALARSMQIGSHQASPLVSNSNHPNLVLDVGEYTGETKDGLPHGMGTLTYRKGLNGKQHVGHFQNGKPNGWGVVDLCNGGRREGEFRDGKFHGKAKRVDANGDIYEGTWENDNLRNGVIKYADGSGYEGEFNEQGVIHGHGTYTWSYGTVYTGSWRDGKRNGQGKNTTANGDYYEGDWVNDKKHGVGTWLYNYHVYQGTFKDNKFWSGTWSGGVTTPNRGTYVNGKSLYEKGCCTIL